MSYTFNAHSPPESRFKRRRSVAITRKQVSSGDSPRSLAMSGAVPMAAFMVPSAFAAVEVENMTSSPVFGSRIIANPSELNETAPSPDVVLPTSVAQPLRLQNAAKPSAAEKVP